MATETRDLNFLQANPDLLVPEELLKKSAHPDNIDAVPFETWIGSFENGYKPPLSVLIVARGGLGDPILLQEYSNVWGSILSNYRESAIKQGLLLHDDFVLASIVAGSPIPEGVFIDSFLVTQTLRQTMGSLFIGRLADQLYSLGYKFLSEVTLDPRTPSFNISYSADQLKPAGNIYRWFSGVPHRSRQLGIGRPAISFLDQYVEKECVKPEFLKV